MGLLEHNKQRAQPITFQVLSPFSKHFPWSLYQVGAWDKSKWFGKCSPNMYVCVCVYRERFILLFLFFNPHNKVVTPSKLKSTWIIKILRFKKVFPCFDRLTSSSMRLYCKKKRGRTVVRGKCYLCVFSVTASRWQTNNSTQPSLWLNA